MAARTLMDRSLRGRERKPVKRMGAQRESVRGAADRRELTAPEQLYRRHSLECREVETGVLNEPGEVGDYKNDLVLIPPDESQYAMVVRIQELEGSAAERF